MAEFATPSAAAMSTGAAPAEDTENKHTATTKPEKPDEGIFKAAVETARKVLTSAQDATVCIRSSRPTHNEQTRDILEHTVAIVC